MRRSSSHPLRFLLGAALVTLAACDEFPGSEVIAVGQGPNPDSIKITKVLCPGDRVTEVSLVPAPGGNPQHDQILWKVTSEIGSSQESYVVGEVPPGFVEDVPLTEQLGSSEGLAAMIDTANEAGALVLFEPRELRQDEMLTPEGYESEVELRRRFLQRCGV